MRGGGFYDCNNMFLYCSSAHQCLCDLYWMARCSSLFTESSPVGLQWLSGPQAMHWPDGLLVLPSSAVACKSKVGQRSSISRGVDHIQCIKTEIWLVWLKCTWLKSIGVKKLQFTDWLTLFMQWFPSIVGVAHATMEQITALHLTGMCSTSEQCSEITLMFAHHSLLV